MVVGGCSDNDCKVAFESPIFSFLNTSMMAMMLMATMVMVLVMVVMVMAMAKELSTFDKNRQIINKQSRPLPEISMNVPEVVAACLT